ncbi:serine O-acetyltransferase [Methanomassiliicoccus luminyensis]|uniref:serine O-acetyltransferase n=1 Tax=Methanomassiliicoccus luminyensis TaxID=1080712 RepID=UPI0009DA2637|nr:serine O-acetyltransferase [Methanomassiliicoccus luminyensis]
MSWKDDVNTVLERDPAPRSFGEALMFSPGLHAIFLYRTSHRLYEKGQYKLARAINYASRVLTGTDIHPGAKIGKGFFIDHATGVVIGETAEIGDNVSIFQGVTLGGVSTSKEKRHPTIGNDVVIGSNATVLGNIIIGAGSKIGAGSVVVKDVPPNSTVVGVPGKVIKVDGRKEAPEATVAPLPDPLAHTLDEVRRAIAGLDSRLNDIEERIMHTADKKATLLLSGPVKIPQDMELPFRASCSTAGPGAGSTGIVLAFEGTRVKKAVSRDRGDFELVPNGGTYSLCRDGEVFIEEVKIEPVVFHAPEQAFFNLDNRCIYGCSFCASPLLEESQEKGHTPEKVMRMIVEAHHKVGFDAVAITSGVPDTAERTVERIAEVVRGVREALPSVTIGVEPYISEMEQIDLLKEAGADEIKLNIETYDRGIFEKVCGKKDYDLILRSIEHAVEVFGRGRVTSNIIIGLGESDENVLQGVEHLAEIGSVATLRALRTNNMNRNALASEIGSVRPVDKDRLLRLVRAQKDILERHGLSTLTFETMCNRCGCCDIVPFVDIR